MTASEAASHRVKLQPAYVLHNRPYRNTSSLLEIFSHDYGRCALVARGVRQGNSRLQGQLTPFAPLLLSWQGRGEVYTLTAAEAAAPAPVFSGRQILTGFYLNELLLRLMHRGDAHTSVFEAYADTLHSLSLQPGDEAALRRFELALLREIGYGLMFEHEAETGAPIESARQYCYQFERGPLRADTAAAEGVMISGRTLLAMQQDCFEDEDVLKEAKHLMRAALSLQLDGRPLKSRELYRQQQDLLKRQTSERP